MENKPTYAILHHTADTSTGAQLRKVDEYHKLRFDMRSALGYWVGYHYFIERDGAVTQTRKDNEEGAHTKGLNLESLGICLAGNFDFEVPTEAQLNALLRLQENLAVAYGVSDFPVAYHFKYSDTHCPGLYFQGEEWRRLLLQNQLNFLQRLLSWIKTNLKF